VFVGEGPGADEDQQGVPFVGRAGQLLNKIINAMGIQRDDVYICNVVKCRPPENRTPESAEILACSPFLEEQIALIAPKVIVTLGGPATKTLLQTSQGIMSIRGRWFAYKGIPVMPTYHPAFVLRSYTEENRRAVWDDMKKVMERIKQA
jgi:uracil-DNA glycosylase